MPDLVKFQTLNHVIDVSEEIGTDYIKFGILLLEEKTGRHIQSIEREHLRISREINQHILMEWLGGKGKPREWKELVKVLDDTGLKSLAKDINETLCTNQ